MTLLPHDLPIPNRTFFLLSFLFPTLVSHPPSLLTLVYPGNHPAFSELYWFPFWICWGIQPAFAWLACLGTLALLLCSCFWCFPSFHFVFFWLLLPLVLNLRFCQRISFVQFPEFSFSSSTIIVLMAVELMINWCSVLWGKMIMRGWVCGHALREAWLLWSSDWTEISLVWLRLAYYYIINSWILDYDHYCRCSLFIMSPKMMVGNQRLCTFYTFLVLFYV